MVQVAPVRKRKEPDGKSIRREHNKKTEDKEMALKARKTARNSTHLQNQGRQLTVNNIACLKVPHMLISRQDISFSHPKHKRMKLKPWLALTFRHNITINQINNFLKLKLFPKFIIILLLNIYKYLHFHFLSNFSRLCWLRW